MRLPGVTRRDVLAGLSLLTLSGCVGGDPRRRPVRIATGATTGVYHPVGSAFAAIVNRELSGADATVLVTAASEENVRLLVRGRAELAFTQADVLVTGEDVTTGLTALARAYDDCLHLVVLTNSPVTTLKDLRGRRVAVGVPGSGTAVTVRRLLEVAQLDGTGVVDRVELGLDDSLAGLASGAIDAFFFSGGLPVAGIAELSDTASIRVVDLAEWAEPLRVAYSDVYVVRQVPTPAYQAPAVATVAVPNLLVVAESMATDLARDLTRLLLGRRSELTAAHPAAEGLDPRSAIATLPLPLHAGATEFYRSVKP